jgi:hypothetical protein
LFARDARDGSMESEKHVKGKEREMDRNRDIDFKKWQEERFREFGKELPKSWHADIIFRKRCMARNKISTLAFTLHDHQQQ